VRGRSSFISTRPSSRRVAPPESHAKFREKYHWPFTLLSDEQKTVIKMYGLNGPLGIGVRRASYLVDGGRRVRDAVLADFRIARHMDFVRKAVALRT
jgi:peroxiredoxin Q/BCP